jgi:rhodanese-related sulfurtransferase
MDKWSRVESSSVASVASVASVESGCPGVSVVSVDDVAARGGDVLLIDVRESDEWAAGHVAVAIHVPLGDIVAWVPPAVTTPLAIICRSGNRSMKAAVLLAGRGVTAFNVEGGMRAWDSANLEYVANDGSPGEVI